MATIDNRAMCKYGEKCYQKNPEHHKKFKHPKRKNCDPLSNDAKRNKCENLDIDYSKEMRTEDANSFKPEEKLNQKHASQGEKKERDKETLSEILKLSSNICQQIEAAFLVKMPEDFFNFYDFCKHLNKKTPHNALAAVGLKLVGPFDLIDRDFKDFTQEQGLCHYRYYFDPPEFQTVLTSNDKNLLHYGYFRDEPKELPAFVASNEANAGCLIKIVSDNLFSALNVHIDTVKKVSDPFKKMAIQKIQHSLIDWSKEHNWNMDVLTKKIKERKSRVVAKTFHCAGIVVPFDKKTELGYRALKESDNNIKKLLSDLCGAKNDDERKIFWTKLHPFITYANIANDEFDFGTSLELGLDLFCFGDPLLHKTVLQILSTSYELLGRNEFSLILKAHLQNRTKGSDVDTIKLS